MLPVVAGAVIKNPKPKALISYLLLISGIPTFVYSFIFGRFMLLGAFLLWLFTYMGSLHIASFWVDRNAHICCFLSGSGDVFCN